MEKLPEITWHRRRRFLYAVCLFCGLVIGYCLYTRADTRVAETAVMMAFVIIGMSVGSYVFGAAWQDVTQIRTAQSGYSAYSGFGPAYAARSSPAGGAEARLAAAAERSRNAGATGA